MKNKNNKNKKNKNSGNKEQNFVQGPIVKTVSVDMNYDGKKGEANIEVDDNGKHMKKHLSFDKKDLAKLLSFPSRKGLLHERLLSDFPMPMPSIPMPMPIVVHIPQPQPHLLQPEQNLNLAESLSRAKTRERHTEKRKHHKQKFTRHKEGHHLNKKKTKNGIKRRNNFNKTKRS